MRTSRLRKMMVSGWIESSGRGSEMAGMNGGFDWLAGRLVVYDEIMKELASQDSSRLEYMKMVRSNSFNKNTHRNLLSPLHRPEMWHAGRSRWTKKCRSRAP